MEKEENINENTTENTVYEVGFHLLPTVEEGEVEGIVSSLKTLISKNGGEVISEDSPKMRNLAYSISKTIGTKNQSFSKAYFGWVKFEIGSEAVNIIKSSLDAEKNILRFLITKTVKENTMYYPPSNKKVENEKEEFEEVATENAEVKEVKEEDLDKSIEELVIN